MGDMTVSLNPDSELDLFEPPNSSADPRFILQLVEVDISSWELNLASLGTKTGSWEKVETSDMLERRILTK